MPLITDILPIFKIKIKSRPDSAWDQYNRVFMVKILIVMTAITGINWYKDKINCITPKLFSISDDMKKYISSTCWIQGVYVYNELVDNQLKMAYYGIPRDVAITGLNEKKQRCMAGQPSCKEMDKTFYLQYQWLPFFLFACACLYYLPYVLYKWINFDILQLFEMLENKPVKYQHIKRKLFKPVVFDNGANSIQVKNIFVKVLYIFVNVIVFYMCNQLFNGNFLAYGTKWIRWNNLNNTIQYDYMGNQNMPRPGNEFLPPFGFCELYLQSRDAKFSLHDKQKLVCEMSQNILYQYAFMVLWFAIIMGICVSIISFILEIFHFVRRRCLHKITKARSIKEELIYKTMSPRQREMLEMIRDTNKVKYGELVDFITSANK